MAIESIAQTRKNALLDLADGISGNGTSTMRLDLLGSDDGDSMDVTARDIEQLVSLAEEIRISLASLAVSRPTPSVNARSATPQAVSSSSCLASLLDGPWNTCNALSNTPPEEMLGWNEGGLLTVLSRAITYSDLNVRVNGMNVRPCGVNAKAISPGLVASQLLQFLLDTGIKCKLHPTKPVRFLAKPLPDPIPVGPSESTGNQGTQMQIRLEPYWTPQFTVDEFLRTHYLRMVNQALSNAVTDGQCAADFTQSFSAFGGLHVPGGSRPSAVSRDCR